MVPPRKCTATKAAAKYVLALALLCCGALAHAAQVAGTVLNLNGPLMVKKADGSIKALGQRSEVLEGDTLMTQQGTYARIKFVDDSEMTLKPNTTFKIENFSFDTAKPEADNAVFSLLKGGMRALTGLLGKRSKERFGLNTPTATIGIRGTTFLVDYVEPVQVQADPDPESGVPGGTYVQVIDGLVVMTNKGGQTQYGAGQAGFAGDIKIQPILLPNKPNLKFAPPAAFQANAGGKGGDGAGAGKGEIDCEIR